MTETAPASAFTTRKVFESISAITGELAKIGIAKDRENKQQGYSFRGIDQVYNVLAPLLAKYRLNILPQVLERTERLAKSKGGGDLNFVVLKVNYLFVSADDASFVTITTYGEGMDSADKATNKALSAAYKYAVIQAFAIPVEGQPDADAETPTEDAAQPAQAAPYEWTEEKVKTITEGMKAARLSEKKTLKYFKAEKLTDLSSADVVTLQGFIDAKMKEQQSAGPAQG